MLNVTIHTRTKGHSVFGGVAYRCGKDLVDTSTGEVHAYSKGRGADVIDYGIVGGRFDSEQQWAEAIERVETRCNSQLFRDVVAALPDEMDESNQVELAIRWSSHLAEEYLTSTLFAVHRPSKEGDERNVHVHALLPTRSLVGSNAFGGPKFRHINRAALRQWHESWDSIQAEALAAAGIVVPDPPMKAECPKVHLGRKAIAMERRRAAERDRARAKAEGCKYVPIRREVTQLLEYSGRVSDQSKEWWLVHCRNQRDHCRMVGADKAELLAWEARLADARQAVDSIARKKAA